MTSDMVQQVKAGSRTAPIELSVISPIYNERENIPKLVDRLLGILKGCDLRFEVILVDDGSSDGSAAELETVARAHPEIKIVTFRRNFGQTAAMMAGIDHASGDIIVTIDADLQNDPEDIPGLLERLTGDVDVVSGWRQNRKDARFRRNFVSSIANKLISVISGVELHDYGCTLKAYRHEVLGGMRLYGEMHRFIPIYASWMGGRVIEMPVRHHAREHGVSKYGLGRTLKVVLDLMVVKFFSRHLVKPIYVFGGFGLWMVLGSILTLGYALYLKLFENTSLIQTPLPVLAAVLFLMGIISVLMGLLAEIMVRTYFESRGQRAYAVRRTLNFDV